MREVVMYILVGSIAIVAALLFCVTADAGSREQAQRIHNRIAGVSPLAVRLDEMAALIQTGSGTEEENAQAAAFIAMQHPDFYRTTLKNFSTPWTNRDQDVFAALNDYSATVIGMVRDDVDFREILTGDIVYLAPNVAVPGYSTSDNRHYEELEQQGLDLASVLVRSDQSSLTGVPPEATAGVITTRAGARAFFIAGTNRAMFRFTLLNHLCMDLEEVKDITRAPDRIRQDVTRSPGGDSRLFRNNCIGCHSGMDPMTQAFAYYNFEYDPDNDPEGNSGQLVYNRSGTVDVFTGTRVVKKYHHNQNNFPTGYVTVNDNWDNYWREGRNQRIGWDSTLTGSGTGAKSMGRELANSQAFAACQVTKVFREVCLRDPVDAADRSKIDSMVSSFSNSGFKLKQPFAESAAYCRGG
ncbi:MAG: hypothetical protein ABGY96_30025 [bacterium]